MIKDVCKPGGNRAAEGGNPTGYLGVTKFNIIGASGLYDSARGEIQYSCPSCGQTHIHKVPAAIRICRGSALLTDCKATGRRVRVIVGTVAL